MAMIKLQTKQIVLVGISLCLLLALQTFMVNGPASIIHSLSGDKGVSELIAIACPLSFSLTFFFVAITAYFRPNWLEHAPFLPTLGFLAAGFILLFMSTNADSNVLPLLLSAVLSGVGQALGFVCQTRIFFSLELNTAKALLIISSIFPIIPYFFSVAFNANVDTVIAVVAFVLFPLSMASLFVVLRIIPLKDLNNVSHEHRSKRYRAVFANLWPSIALAFLLGLMGPLVDSFVTNVGTSELLKGLIFSAGNTCAALIALLLWFGFKVRITVPAIFLFGFPFIITILFAFPFTDAAYWPVFQFVGNTFFCLVSIAVMVTCLETARYEHVNILVIYGLFAGFMYISREVGLGIGAFAAQLGPNLHAPFVALVLMYVFSLAVFFILLRSRHAPTGSASNQTGQRSSLVKGLRKSTSEGRSIFGKPISQLSSKKTNLNQKEAHANQDAAAVSEEFDALKEQFGLSKREVEVLSLIVRGRNVPAISQLLSISENTVRTHVKKIYSTLDVHSRQELIDFIDHSDALK